MSTLFFQYTLSTLGGVAMHTGALWETVGVLRFASSRLLAVYTVAASEFVEHIPKGKQHLHFWQASIFDSWRLQSLHFLKSFSSSGFASRRAKNQIICTRKSTQYCNFFQFPYDLGLLRSALIDWPLQQPFRTMIRGSAVAPQFGRLRPIEQVEIKLLGQI